MSQTGFYREIKRLCRVDGKIAVSSCSGGSNHASIFADVAAHHLLEFSTMIRGMRDLISATAFRARLVNQR
jgi:hypothetical protein